MATKSFFENIYIDTPEKMAILVEALDEAESRAPSPLNTYDDDDLFGKDMDEFIDRLFE
ncbi:MAG: hypothetical protein LBV63_03955 [Candidatus Methanoplasma sp.]|jgi:hypothetical protein|nr:hypothetical protein [Candidatus Methanoplasma sp.]